MIIPPKCSVGLLLFECLNLYVTIRNLFHRRMFEGAFAKLQKATISFVMSTCSFETMRLPLDRFSWNYFFEYFSKICQEI